MSILIKGLEMPKRCSECEYLWFSQINQTGKCGITETLFDGYMETRSPDCPLIEIPPHGRLIDADTLEGYLPPPMCELDESYLSLFRNLFKLMPTVIEAEVEA